MDVPNLEPTKILQIFVHNKIRQFSAGLGIRSSVFQANCSFLPKNERMSDSLKNERFAHLLIFGERPERFTHDCSFLMSNLSKSLMVAHFW